MSTGESLWKYLPKFQTSNKAYCEYSSAVSNRGGGPRVKWLKRRFRLENFQFLSPLYPIWVFMICPKSLSKGSGPGVNAGIQARLFWVLCTVLIIHTSELHRAQLRCTHLSTSWLSRRDATLASLSPTCWQSTHVRLSSGIGSGLTSCPTCLSVYNHTCTTIIIIITLKNQNHQQNE